MRTCLSSVSHIVPSHPPSESSSQALSVFNKMGLLDVVIQCLERHQQNVELAISAGRLRRDVANGRHFDVSEQRTRRCFSHRGSPACYFVSGALVFLKDR